MHRDKFIKDKLQLLKIGRHSTLYFYEIQKWRKDVIIIRIIFSIFRYHVKDFFADGSLLEDVVHIVSEPYWFIFW